MRMSMPTKECSAASGLLMELLEATQTPLALTSQIWSSPEKPCASCRKLLTARHLRVFQQRGAQDGFRRFAVHGIILGLHQSALDHVHFGHGCGDGARHRKVAGDHLRHVVDDRRGHLPLRTQGRVQLLLYHPVRDHAGHEPANQDDQHEADRPGCLAQGCPVHRPSDPSGCDMQLAHSWQRARRCFAPGSGRRYAAAVARDKPITAQTCASSPDFNRHGARRHRYCGNANCDLPRPSGS